MNFFISQPMSGLSNEEIFKTREEIRIALEKRGHKIIDSYFMDPCTDKSVNQEHIWYLSRAFLPLSKADAIIVAPDWEKSRGCRCEIYTALQYANDHKIRFFTYKILHRCIDKGIETVISKEPIVEANPNYFHFVLRSIEYDFS